MPEGLTIPIIFTAALVDSINPCVIGVLIFLIAFMTRLFKNPYKMVLGGLLYTSVVYITYLLIGIGILKIAGNIGITVAFYYFAAAVAILAGLLEIKDYFWYGRGLSLQIVPGGAARIKYYTGIIEKMEGKHPALLFLTLVLLGIFVTFVELPFTCAPYLAILALLSKGQFSTAIPLLLFYNLIFIVPLLFIIGLTYFGTSSEVMEEWRKKHRGLMRLGIGIFLIGLGLYMIYSLRAFA